MTFRPLRLARLLPFAWLCVTACGGAATQQLAPDASVAEPLPGVRAVFDPTLSPKRGNKAASWLAYPFPSDHRRGASGRVDLQNFPNPDANSLLEKYLATGEAELDGWGLDGATHVLFDGPLDVSTIPAQPEAFLSADAPIQLVDVTPGSPELGRRRPLRWQYWDRRGKYVYENSLAVAPAWGFPLRERTTYALLVTDAVKGADGHPLRQHELLAALLAGTAQAPAVSPAVPAALYEALLGQFAPLRALLADEGFDVARVAVATVFTTQDVTGPLAKIHAQLRQAPPPSVADWRTPRGAAQGARWFETSFRWSSTQTAGYYVMEGSFDAPNYQRGEVPYASEGGGFLFVDGEPVPARTERLRFALSFPKQAPQDGGCFPIVEVAHGTGGDAYSFFDDRTAGRLAGRGLAGIGLDQPLHGERTEGRDYDVDYMSFNYLNPEGARTTFRQSAVDTFALTRLLKGGLKVPAEQSPTGHEICFRNDRLGFFGHSQGGLTGALAAALEGGIGAWVFSGAGGGLGITLLERKDIVDAREALTMLLQLGEGDEVLTDLHPAMTLVQLLVDVTDPINYSASWTEAREGKPAASVLMTSGLHDEQTPYRTATALALAGRVPAVAPLAVEIPEYGWAGMALASAPLRGNLGNATAGLLQFGDGLPGWQFDTHFLVFHRPEAIHASMRFLQSAAQEGSAVIERVPGADAR